MSLTAQQWLQQIDALKQDDRIRIMNVCGGHERAISSAGLRNVLPDNVELIPGPGCPVCICPEEDIFDAIQLALHHDVIMVAFGDMLRVPINVAKNDIRSLEQARAAGADIRPIASPTEAVNIAEQHADKSVVFFAAGFETTMAPVAAMLASGIPDNLFLFLSGRLTWPAVSMLLQSGRPGFDALIAPGHVATVMGAEQWQFVVDQYHIPTAVAGFTPESLLAAFYSVMRQLQSYQAFLDNCYPEVVTAAGNIHAQRVLKQVMLVVDANWRGIGNIPLSGFALNEAYASHDARKAFTLPGSAQRKRAGEMPAGCDCANVVLGKLYPDQCQLYDRACNPRQPVGPCMVSDEGACHIWWRHGIQNPNKSASG